MTLDFWGVSPGKQTAKVPSPKSMSAITPIGATRLTSFCVAGVVDVFAAEQGELTLHVLQLIGWGSVGIAVPNRNVGVLARFQRTDLILEKELVCGRNGVGLQGRVYVDRFRGAEGLLAVSAIERSTSNSRPESEAGRVGSYEEVRAAGPEDAPFLKCFQRKCSWQTLRAERGSVKIAD